MSNDNTSPKTNPEILTTLTLILTDPHNTYKENVKCCPRLGFELGMSNVENLNGVAYTLTVEQLLPFEINVFLRVLNLATSMTLSLAS